MKVTLRTAAGSLALLLLCVLVGSPGSGQPLDVGPVDPGFVAYLDAVAAGVWTNVTADGRGLGYIPPPFLHNPNLPPGLPPRLFHTPGPSYYLTSVPGKLPGILNQGACGSCWTFGTYGSMESCARPSDTSNWSENHLKNNHGYDWSCCSGGNYDIAAAYLARWGGPRNDSDDPYTYPSCTSAGGTYYTQRHIQDILWMPTNNPTVIKDHIYHYGGVATSYYHDPAWPNPYENSAGTTYYYNGDPYPATLPNHAVTIVGWDDNYPAANFKINPGSNGGWLVRNSWGAYNGGFNPGPPPSGGGYFWVSYQDTLFAKIENALFLATEPTDNLAYCYEYDPLGRTGKWGYTTSGGYIWCANIFPRVDVNGQAQQQLEAVSFYTNSAGDNYILEVRRNCSTTNPRSGGTLAHSSSATLTYEGYYTIHFTPPIDIDASDTRFSVTLRLGPGPYQLALEWVRAGYSSGASSSAGQSFMGWDGSTWYDAYNWPGYWTPAHKCNVCIKAWAYGGAYPARLSGLRAEGEHGQIRVTWETATEVGTAGFIVVRSERREGPFERIDGRVVAATGQPGQVAKYELVDETAQAGRMYYYRIREVFDSGTINEIDDTAKAAVGSAGLHDLLPAQIRTLLPL